MRLALLALALCAATVHADLADRWFYISRNLNSDKEVEDFRQLCATAAQHGYNGVCWAGPEGV